MINEKRMQVGNVTLREYQEKAVEKFHRMRACLIAFDKRGGKTMTALALAQKLIDYGEVGPVLIVSDKTSQWERDFRKIGLDRSRLHLVDTPRRVRFTKAVQNINPYGCDFYQIHWAGLNPMKEELSKVKWVCVITDELHAAKNRKSLRTLALKKISRRTPFKIGLTADPSDNAPQDVWSLLNWLYPKLFSSFWRFIDEHVVCEEHWGRRGKYKVFLGPKNVEKFQEMLSEFYISLTLEEIDPGQRPIEYSVRYVEMGPAQRKAYEDLVEIQIAQLADSLLIAELPMIVNMRLQQIAQSMIISEDYPVMRTRTRKENGKIVKYKEEDTATKVTQVEPSPKLDELMEVLQNDYTPCIVFTESRDMVKLGSDRMRRLGIPHVSVVGGDNVEEAEKRFQDGEVRVIIGTTSMIAESIELDRADQYIFLDSPWSPRVRSQAEGRGKAVGKRRKIRCIDIKTRGTVDEERLDKVRTKEEWIDILLGRTNGR